MVAGTVGGRELGSISLWAVFTCLISSEQSNLRMSGQVEEKRSYCLRRILTSSALSSRKACSNSSVRMEMMWSAGAVGLVFLGVGVVPNS